MPSRPIRFFHRGAVVEVDGAAPTRTVLDWLREDARCTGTKEGCNEGDCGACTVVVGELAAGRRGSERRRLRPAPAQRQRLHPVPADARRQGAVHGRGPGTAPTARCIRCSRRWSTCHGSQCGFCTPGFVMSLWATYQHHGARGTRPTRQQHRRRAVGQPLPLHRLPADPRCRRAHVRPARRAARRRAGRRGARRRCATPRRCAASARTAPSSSRRARWPSFAAAAPRPARRAHPRRLDRHRPVGHQACSATCRDLIYIGDGRRAEADRRARRRAVDRRRRVARGRLARARRALAEPARRLAALRLAADPPRRHDGRQRRQRLADRRLGAGADGARRDARPAPRRSGAARAARRLLHRLHEEPARAGRVRAGDRGAARARARSAARLQDLEALRLRHLRASAPGSRSSSTATARSPRRASPSAAWRRRSSARARAEAALRRPALGRSRRSPPRRRRWRSDFTPLTDMRASAAYRLQVAQNLLQPLLARDAPSAPLAGRASRACGASMAHVVARSRTPRATP